MAGRVLTPLDGTPFGEYALPWASAIAVAARWPLHLVHAHVPDPRIVRPGLGGTSSGAVRGDRRLRSRRGYLETVAGRWGLQGGAAVALRADDGVPEAIRRHAEKLGDTRLIVMSTHGRTGLDRLWMGSVADALVRTTRIPVLLVRPETMAGDDVPEVVVRRVLVPLDGTGLGESILKPLLELGPSLGWSFLFLHAVSPLLQVGARRYPVRTHSAMEERRRGRTYLERVARLFRRRGLRARIRVVEDDSPERAIVRASQRADVDLVAMATHGRGGVSRALLGSVADQVLSAISLPLLLGTGGDATVH